MEDSLPKRIRLTASIGGVVLLLSGMISVGVAFMLRGEETPRVINPSYPLATFEDPGLARRTDIVLAANSEYTVLASQRQFIDHSLFCLHLLRPTNSHLVEILGRKLWCSREIVVLFDKRKNSWMLVPQFDKAPWFLPLSLFAFSASAFCLPFMLSSPHRAFPACVFHVAVWIGLALYTIHANGLFLVFNAGDPQQFYQMAHEWLSWDRRSPVPNSVGASALYMLFITLFHPKDYLDIAIHTSFATALIYPVVLIPAIFLLAKTLGASGRCAHVAATSFTLFSTTALVRGCPGGTLLSIFMRTEPFSVFLYNKGFLLGWNGMSDNYGVIFPMLGMLAMALMRSCALRYLLMGLLFGYGISTRYANIVLLPAIFFWDLTRPAPGQKPSTKILFHYAIFGAAGLVGCAPQLLDNYLVNGNPLQPTVHFSLFRGEHRVVNLFSCGNVIDGLRFYMTAHFKLLTVFACSLLFARGRRAILFLWLWVVCVLVFYSSTNFYGDNELRYLLVIIPPVFIALGLAALSLDRGEMLLVSLSLLTVYCLCSPELPSFHVFKIPTPLHHAGPALIGGLALGVALVTKRNISAAMCLAGMMLALSSGQWWVPAVLLLLCPLRLASEKLGEGGDRRSSRRFGL